MSYIYILGLTEPPKNFGARPFSQQFKITPFQRATYDLSNRSKHASLESTFKGP